MNTQKKKLRIPLLLAVILAIIAGIFGGLYLPESIIRIFATFNALFSAFLGFIVPLIILGLVAPGIAELGSRAGKLLLITVAIAYGFTLFAGFFTYFVCDAALPSLLGVIKDGAALMDTSAVESVKPFFKIDLPPIMGVISALVFAFILGLGIASSEGITLKKMMEEFKEITYKTINKIIIPLLPLFICGIFMDITVSGQVMGILSVFIKLVAVIFLITIVMLLLQYIIAWAVSGANPFISLKNMLPAYATALGTQSSAATIPVTLRQTLKNGVAENVASFVVPLCATIHLSGSTMKIVACSMAIMMISSMPFNLYLYTGFIFMLGISMVAAPGVPGGAIMAALGVLSGILGFDEKAIALMIALYIAMDSFGTACNVTGDGAIALIINKIYKPETDK